MLHKAGKAIERLNVIQTEQEAIIQHQQAQIERLESKKPQKKIVIDPNIWFVNIEEIKKLKDEATALKAKKKKRDWQLEAQKALEAIQKTTFKSILFQ